VLLKRLRWWVTHHWKGYDDGWHITEKTTLTWTEKSTGDISLKRLWWQVTYHWKGYVWHITEKATMMGDISLKRLPWHITKKPMGDISLKRLPWRELKSIRVTYHWKGYDDGWHVTEKATLTYHWKSYGWHITEKATMTGDISLKRLPWLKIKILSCVN
jgi:hypothetical protein